MSFGFVMQRVYNSDELPCYYAADNNLIFLIFTLPSDESGLIFMKSELKEDEILPSLFSQLPDTKGKFFCVTNVTLFVFLLSGVQLGCTEQSFPSAILSNPIVKSFFADCKTSPTKTICVCFVHSCVELQQNTAELMQTFFSVARRDVKTVSGIHEDDIPVLEALVDIYN